jgi:phosphatidylethanolamine-binding protein (PEBP) family uncharacterized protein
MNPGRQSMKLAFSALVGALALTACGGAKSTSQRSATPATTAAQVASTQTTTPSTAARSSTTSEKLPTLDITLESPVSLEPIAARYTCDGSNGSLPIAWSHIPAKTVELELFVFDALKTHGKNFADWAVAGVKPGLHKLSSGQLPPGAIVGRNGFGQVRYSLCPPKGTTAHYIVLMYALPRRIHVAPGFQPEALRKKAVHVAASNGLLSFFYKRA